MGLFYFFSAEFIRWPSTLGTPEGQLEQPQATGMPQALACSLALGTIGKPEGLLERRRLLERPPGYWNSRLRPLYCLLAGDDISVLYPLRSIRRSAPSGTPEGQLDRPLANGTPSGLLEQPQATGTAFGLGPPAGLSAATRARVCDGNAMNVR